MRRLLLISAGLLLAGSLAAGCGAMRGGQTIVKYDGSNPIVTTAPAAGSYALYSTTDYNPKVVEQLSQNDQLGFKKNNQGQLMAVAGSKEIVLESDKTYYWKRQK